MRGRHLLLAIAAALSVAACDDFTGPTADGTLDAAFATGLFGFGDAASSFQGEAGGDAWMPEGGGRGPQGTGPGGGGPGGHRGGRGGGPGLGGLMRGGLFRGEGFGPGFGRARHGDPSLGDECAFDLASGRVVCEPVERGGLVIERSAAYRDAPGNVQPAFDSLTTNSIDTEVAVSGTVTRRNGATSTVAHESERSVSGLAPGSTARRVNGSSHGMETTTGSDDQGAFTAVREMGDRVSGLVIPVFAEDQPRPYPIAGTVERSMEVTVTREGEAPLTSSRSEVVTYDGSDTATIVITRDGVSTTCSLPLPRGRPVCP